MNTEKRDLTRQLKSFVSATGARRMTQLRTEHDRPLGDEERFIMHVCKELNRHHNVGWDLQFLSIARNRLIRFLALSMQIEDSHDVDLRVNMSEGIEVLARIEALAKKRMKNE